MNAVFLDTVGLLATWDTTDQWQTAARPVFERMMAQRVPVVTTTFVLLECGNAAARRPFRSAVARFREQMEAGGRVIIPTDQDWRDAWEAYSGGDATSSGIVDQISFIVMRRIGITDVFSNDRHFKAAGFNTLF